MSVLKWVEYLVRWCLSILKILFSTWGQGLSSIGRAQYWLTLMIMSPSGKKYSLYLVADVLGLMLSGTIVGGMLSQNTGMALRFYTAGAKAGTLGKHLGFEA